MIRHRSKNGTRGEDLAVITIRIPRHKRDGLATVSALLGYSTEGLLRREINRLLETEHEEEPPSGAGRQHLERSMPASSAGGDF